MPPLSPPVKAAVKTVAPPYADVYCPVVSCARYLGAYVGRTQCPGCKRWVTVALTPRPA